MIALLATLALISEPDPWLLKAQRAMDRGDARTAVALIRRRLHERPGEGVANDARYLLGLGLLETGDNEAAQRVFGELVGTYPALRQDHLWFRGVALYRWGNRLDAAKVLAEIDPKGARGDEARRLRAKALNEATAFSRLRTWLEGVQDREGRLGHQLLYFLGRARHRTGDPFGAYGAFREVWREAPLATYAGDALMQIAKLSVNDKPLMNATERGAITSVRNKLVRDGVASVLPDLERRLAPRANGKALRSQVAYARGRAAEVRGRSGAAAAHFARALAIAPVGMAELRARSALGEGRMARRLGQDRRAIELFEMVAGRFPDRHEAEEALFASAQLHLSRRDHAGAEKRYRLLMLKNPVTPYRAECLWGLGWVKFRLGKYDEARPFFASLTKMRLRANLDAASRYWLARTEASAGELAVAEKGFRSVIATHPISYYASLAADQLAEVIPSLGVAAAPEGTEEKPAALARIEAHVRLGQRKRARRELAQFAKEQATGGRRAPAIVLRTMARLYERLGQHLQARRTREQYAREYPQTLITTEVAAAARRAHPLKYEDEIRAAASEFDIPVALLFGLVRTESAFMQYAVSSQNAMGLAQLIPPTAREVAKRLRAPRATKWRLLNDPAYNVRLGAAYLRGLLDRYEGSEPMALAAYNAGPGAVDSWFAYRVRKIAGPGPARKGVGLAPAADELVEEMPVHETKTYVRAVLARARVYARLYRTPVKVPTMPSGDVPVAVYAEPAGPPPAKRLLAEPPPGTWMILGTAGLRDPDEEGLYGGLTGFGGHATAVIR